MPKFLASPLVEVTRDVTARLGAGTGASNWLSDADRGKAVKLAGESRYALCAAGDEIEGFIVALETATLDNFTIGTVRQDGRMRVTFDGLQATPGTGVIAVGDYVVTGTPVARGTALTFATPARVCKATANPNALVHTWRVISLGEAGTGAVGTVGVIERV